MGKKKTKSYDNIILEIFNKFPKKNFNYKQIRSYIPEKKEALIVSSLKNLYKKKQILETSPGRYVLNKKKYITGVIDKTKKGSGYLISCDHEKDFFISENNLNKALNGDKVNCVKINNREVEVINIIKRCKEKYVGTVFIENGIKKIEYNSNKDSLIFSTTNKNIKQNEIVVFNISNWQEKIPEANIIRVIGEKGDINNEIHAILEEFELPYEFEKQLLKEAEKVKELQNKKEDNKRRDLTNITTFTIDPSDAKDFDDAISVKKINDNQTEIGVHIADVSHFLKENTSLNEEAKKRATSVYLVDRVVPMLPEEISNNLCSLNPQENKYSFSVLFIFEDQRIIKEWYGKTIINSNERLSYKEAQYIIDNNTNKISKEISLSGLDKTISKKVSESIIYINDLAKKLRKKRLAKGSISFNKTEVKFILNKKKEPINTTIKETLSANKLIEEFMLLANKKVAEIFAKEKRGLFRVHDYPDEQKLITLERITKKLGYKQNFKNPKSLNIELNNLLDKIKNKPEKNLIDTLVIRSMSKAKYSTKNIGHFGLCFEKYTHFTSPIRRYPDVLVHRELERILLKQTKKKDIEPLCLHCSSREERATKAERASIKFMQVKYMAKKINQNFNGVISGLTERGIFVEAIDNKCEGFIRIKDVPGDYFVFNEKEMLITGRHTKEEYRLGDSVLIKVEGVNQRKKQIDFSLIEKM